MVSSGESAFNPLLDLRIAVLVPCRNEAASISKVVQDFRSALPGAAVFVYDNNSHDDTAELAREAGAVVRSELLAGKGNVVRRMFADIEADIYVLVDGDDTYDAASAEMLIEKMESECLDMVNAVRVASGATAYRPGHRFGNSLLTGIVALIFGNRFTDLLSGYRIFSRRFVKSFPALASGFEIETELTVHALELRMPIAEIETPYRSRPSGSVSNLRTLHDGWRILRTILLLTKEERPLQFFGLFFAILAASAVILFWPVLITFLETGLVPRFPTAILSTGLMLLAFLSLACGIVLDTVTRGRQEMKRMHYLSIPRHRRGAAE
jgi:glycosyltransferase involved in cell wall biosynthesis